MSIKTRSTFETHYHLENLLSRHRKVFLTRFGDGEMFVMMGRKHRNHKSSEELKRELIESFTINHPQYLIGLSINYPVEKKMTKGVFAPFSMNNELLEYAERNNLIVKDIYENPISFHYISAFYPKIMYDFFEKHIRPKKKMFIGSTSKDVAERLYGNIDYYVNIPPTSAFNTIEEWWPEVEKNAKNVELIIPSAGAASNVISKRLWYQDVDVHLLDIGSLVDAIDGRRSRGWIKRKGHKVQKILPKEHRNKSLKFKLQALEGDFKYFFRRYIKYRNFYKYNK